MLLGDLLARFDDGSLATEAILSLGDLSLLTALRERADADGLALGTLAANAVDGSVRANQLEPACGIP